MKNKKTTSRLTSIRNRILGEVKSPLELTSIRNRILGEGKSALELTDIRNRISGERKRTPLQNKLILKAWADSQEGRMARKLSNSRKFLAQLEEIKLKKETI
jgi:hypothetical protein|tara:strand:- start:209 stop:514 length:306 start_codon:yes stop_codon:yes gene_type:complete